MESMALGLHNILSQNLKTDRLHLKSEKWKWKACDTIERKKNTSCLEKLLRLDKNICRP